MKDSINNDNPYIFPSFKNKDNLTSVRIKQAFLHSTCTHILTMYSFTKLCTVFVILQIAQASSSDCELKISHLVQSLQGCANAHSQQCDDTKQPAPLPSSCQDIYTKWPNSPSGFYQIEDKSRSSPAYVYCNMDELCGSKEDGQDKHI